MKDSGDDTPTKEIPIVSHATPKPFSALSPEEISTESALRIREQITAAEIIERKKRDRDLAEKARQIRENRPPDPYHDRFSVWLVIFQDFFPSIALLIMLGVCIRVISAYSALAEAFWPMMVTVLVITGGVSWYAHRVYVMWNTTYLYSNPQSTGIFRPGNIWLLIDEIDVSLKTSSIQTRKAAINILLRKLGVNAWKVTLLPASEEGKNDKQEDKDEDDNFLKDRRFVRNGKKLLEIVNENQQYKDRS